MANPLIVAIPKDTWVKVATGVLTGTIYLKKTSPAQYFQTYRMTTNPAPTDLADAIAVRGEELNIANSALIDVYIYAAGAAGSVRVDL